jgi:hypothetical protein
MVKVVAPLPGYTAVYTLIRSLPDIIQVGNEVVITLNVS